MSSQSNNFWNQPFARNWVLWSALCLLASWPALADQSVTLTWSPSPIANVAGYNIYYGGASRSYTNSVSLGSVTNITISGLTEGATYYFAATTVDSSGTESDFSNEATYAIPVTVSNTPPVPPSPVPPTFDALTNLTIFQNAGMQTVVLANINSELQDGNQNVSVYAATSDSTIISTPAVNYTSGNNFGSLTFAPAANASGTATVTVTVNNGGASNNLASQTFTVTVLPVPVVAQPPTFGALTNLIIFQNAGRQTMVLTNITSGLQDGNQSVSVVAATSDATIIPTPTVGYTSGNNFGSLTFAPATNALGTATVTVTINNGGASNNLASQTFTVTVVPAPVVNHPPTLNPIANVNFMEDAAAQTITLTGISSGLPTGKQVLKVSATSSNPRLVPTPLIRYISPATTAALTIRPLANAIGSATITVTVTDGGRSNNIVRQSFSVTVQPNQPPTLNPIADVAVVENAAAQIVTLAGITSGSPTENQGLRVSATSSNPQLVPTPVIRYSSPANTASLTFKPTVNRYGSATITVTVNDGGRNNNIIRQSFRVTVTALATGGGTNRSTGLAQTNAVVSANAAATLTTVAGPQNQFSFQVTGLAGGKYVVQATSDLAHWTSVQTNTAPFIFRENTVNGFRQRFYRALYLQ